MLRCRGRSACGRLAGLDRRTRAVPRGSSGKRVCNSATPTARRAISTWPRSSGCRGLRFSTTTTTAISTSIFVQGRPPRRHARRPRGGESLAFRNDLYRPGLARPPALHRRHRHRPRWDCQPQGMGVAVGEYRRRRVARMSMSQTFGANVLYRNNGDGTFSDVTGHGRSGRSALEHERGVSRLRPRWRSRSLRRQLRRRSRVAGNKVCYRSRRARATTARPGHMRPCPSRLFRNDGSGTVHRRDRRSRARRAPTARALGVAVGDFERRRLARSSTWPTTRRPISCGSIGGTARSRIEDCCRARP